MPQCGFHAFRHGNATLHDQIGAPMGGLKNRLGHAQPGTTMRYTHAVPADERKTADQVGKILHVNERNQELSGMEEKPLMLRIQ